MLILAGLSLRVLLSFIPGFKIDVNDWFAWSIRLNEVGLSQFYDPNVFSDYPPGYLYILSLFAFLRELFSINNQLYYLILKLPAIIAEIVLGVFIYQQAKPHFSKKLSILLSSLVMFNPALIFNSAIWGQIDGVLTLLLVYTVHFLKQQKLILASLLFGLSLITKPQAIILIPIFGLTFLQKITSSNFFKMALPALAVLTLLSFPFFGTSSIFGLAQLLVNTASQYNYTSLFAYNFWGIIGFWIKDSTTAFLSFNTWGLILFASFWLFTSVYFFRNRLSLYALTALSCLAFFFLPTRVHERYLYPSLIFLILAFIETKNRLLIKSMIALSVLHLLNLYYVYVYYNEFYYKMPHLLYQPTVYQFLDTYPTILSSISTLIFAITSVVLLAKAKKHVPRLIE